MAIPATPTSWIASTSFPIVSASDLGFFGDEDVAGAGANDRNLALALQRAVSLRSEWRPKPENTRPRGKASSTSFAASGVVRVMRTFSGTLREQRAGNRDDLSRRLTQPEKDFRHAVAQRAMVVHLGESEVFEGQMADAFERFIHIRRTGANIFEQRTQLIFTFICCHHSRGCGTGGDKLEVPLPHVSETPQTNA